MAVENLYIVMKLNFSSFVCGMVELCIKNSQAQKLMVSFMFHDLEGIRKSFLNLLVKPWLIEKYPSTKNLCPLN